MVVPPDVQPFPPSFLLLLLILIFFLVLRQKSFWDPTQPEMFMRWSHQWMRPINKGSPFGQMCQFPFFHLFAAWIFFSIIQKIEPAMLYKFSYKIVKPTFLQGGKLTLQLLRCLDLFVFCYKLVVFHQKLPNIVNFCEFSAFILSTNACQNLIFFWYSTKCN